MMKNILIVAFLLLTNVSADFIRDNTLEVVNDTATCLMWQDDNASKTVKKTWQEAIDYCEDMSFAGYDDWRLPNFNELYSIGDIWAYKPAIKNAFKNVNFSSSYDYYWSSTTVVDSSYAWLICFRNGSDFNKVKRDNNYVRCVRDGQ